MTGDKAGEPGPPETLWQVHEVLGRERPLLSAPLGEWLAYHQRAVALYAGIAEIDRSHHHEALFMAEQARESVREIEAQIPSRRSGDV
jgi:hypothetical protein